MSGSIVWLAVQGIHPDDFLDDAGFVDSGEADEFFEAEFAGAAHPDGWYVMMGDAIDLLDIDNLKEWSEGGRLVAVAITEEALTSIATEWRDGRPVWSVAHEMENGEPVVSLDGEMPASWEAVRLEFLEKLDGDTPAEMAFEAPIELAWKVTGFRHDLAGFADDAPVFTRLEEA